MKEKYICTEAEYKVIDKVMQASHMQDSFILTQISIDEDTSDVWFDQDNSQVTNTYVSFSTGLHWMFEGFENQDNLYDLTDSEAKTLLDLDKRFTKVYPENTSYETLLGY